MEKSLFEQYGGEYVQQGDYALPDLALPTEKEVEIGVFGQRYRRHLKANHRVRYYNLLTSGKLNKHLAEVNEQANEMFLRLVNDLAQREQVDEKLKAADGMAWVCRMNSMRNRATEIVNAELIFV